MTRSLSSKRERIWECLRQHGLAWCASCGTTHAYGLTARGAERKMRRRERGC